MNLASLFISMASMGGMGALFSAGLAVANKKLHVEEDPRIADIVDVLPGANCGGCGYAGCGNFAENIVNGKSEITGCPVCSDDAVTAMAAIMGLEAKKAEKMVARVLCQGGINETLPKGQYLGIQACTAAHITGGGDKRCSYGCLGFGECVEACPFDAMYMSENGLPVIIEEKCTGCGKCAEACPRNIIELHPLSDSIFVACKNEDLPKKARKVCTKACVGCSLCIRGADEGHMVMENNLARIDYSRYGQADTLPTDKCPTQALILLDSHLVKTEVA